MIHVDYGESAFISYILLYDTQHVSSFLFENILMNPLTLVKTLISWKKKLIQINFKWKLLEPFIAFYRKSSCCCNGRFWYPKTKAFKSNSWTYNLCIFFSVFNHQFKYENFHCLMPNRNLMKVGNYTNFQTDKNIVETHI